MGTPFSHCSSSWARTSGGSCRSDMRTMTASPRVCRSACMGERTCPKLRALRITLTFRSEQLGENFGWVLQVGHEDNDGIAASLQERMHGGGDVSEVTRVADNRDIRVGGSNFTEDSEGGVAGRVVDEDVLVAVFSKAQHKVTHALVHFADIAFLVETGRDYADGLHFVNSTHLPPPAFAA